METLKRRPGPPLALATLLLAACAGPERPAPPPAAGPPPDYSAERRAALVAAGWTVCTIAAENSLLRIFVYRAGRLARLGHNHVIAARRIGGYLAFAGPRLTADLYLPVPALSVDEPALRAAAGEAFDSELDESDRAGTRTNLLGAQVLNAAAHPFLRARVAERDWSRSYPELPVAFEAAGREVRATVRLDRLEAGFASGGFSLTHEALALEPFSALGGALRVAEEIDVRFELQLADEPAACGRQGPPPRVAAGP